VTNGFTTCVEGALQSAVATLHALLRFPPSALKPQRTNKPQVITFDVGSDTPQMTKPVPQHKLVVPRLDCGQVAYSVEYRKLVEFMQDPSQRNAVKGL
jgi:hypothetical protein